MSIPTRQFHLDILPPGASVISVQRVNDGRAEARFRAVMNEAPPFGWTDWIDTTIGTPAVELVWAELIALRP